MAEVPVPLAEHILHGAYWGYYLMVPTPVLYFAFRGERDNARRAILIEGGTFLFCYLIFVFFPVAGPYNYFPWPTGEVLNNPSARLVYATLADGNSYGAAFPSSHVAATTSAVIAAFIGSRWLGWGLLVPAILLAFGTVYCHMHYAIDAVVGVIVGITVPGDPDAAGAEGPGGGAGGPVQRVESPELRGVRGQAP